MSPETCATCGGDKKVVDRKLGIYAVVDCPACTGKAAPAFGGNFGTSMTIVCSQCNAELPEGFCRVCSPAPSGAVSEEPISDELLAALIRSLDITSSAGVAPWPNVVRALRELQQRRPTEEMRRDAERYRWLRDDGLPECCIAINGAPSYSRLTTAQVDAAIDAAISQGGPEG